VGELANHGKARWLDSKPLVSAHRFHRLELGADRNTGITSMSPTMARSRHF
jgi:hypothetical protein